MEAFEHRLLNPIRLTGTSKTKPRIIVLLPLVALILTGCGGSAGSEIVASTGTHESEELNSVNEQLTPGASAASPLPTPTQVSTPKLITATPTQTGQVVTPTPPTAAGDATPKPVPTPTWHPHYGGQFTVESGTICQFPMRLYEHRPVELGFSSNTPIDIRVVSPSGHVALSLEQVTRDMVRVLPGVDGNGEVHQFIFDNTRSTSTAKVGVGTYPTPEFGGKHPGCPPSQ